MKKSSDSERVPTKAEDDCEMDPEEGASIPKRLMYSDEKFKPKIKVGAPCMPGELLKALLLYY